MSLMKILENSILIFSTNIQNFFIFLFGNHIGGYTELKDLHDSGTLMNIVDDKTNPYICQHCGKSSSTKQLSCGCFYKPFNDWGAPY